MTARPEFTVVAGPNGAGKSRLSPYYLHCDSFDGDLLALRLRREHPDWQDRWIEGSVAGELQRQKEAAIQARRDFAFETNFSGSLVLMLMEEFKAAGYKMTLLYFGIGTLEESTYRVLQRAMLGGHDVKDEVIEYNFHEGIRLVREHLHLFDNLMFVDGSSGFGEIVAIHIRKSARHEVCEHASGWFNRFFADMFDHLRSRF